jgi:hypothetical protein
LSNGGARRSGQASRAPTTRGCWETISIDKLVAWLGTPLDEFPAWACAHLEGELAAINELARTFRDNSNPPRWCQIDDRIAELKRLILYRAKR